MRKDYHPFRTTETRFSLPNGRTTGNYAGNQPAYYQPQNYFQGQYMRTTNSFYPRNSTSQIPHQMAHNNQGKTNPWEGGEVQNGHFPNAAQCYNGIAHYCAHQCLKDMEGPANCKQCGIFMSSTRQLAIKGSTKKGEGFRESVEAIMQSLAFESEHFKKSRLVKFGQSYSEYRNLLINWMVIKAGESELGKLTQHHAIAIMDALLSKIEVKDQDLKLVTACSLHISAKLNQKEVDIPTLDAIWQRSVSFYTQHDIKLMEMFIMSHLDNNFYYLPVPLRIVQAFLDQGVLFPNKDFLSPWSEFMEINEDFARHFQKTAHFIADFFIIQIKLLSAEALYAAASIIAVTRKILGIEPVWGQQLEELTKLPAHQFADFANILFEEYLLRFGGNTPMKPQSQMVQGAIKFAPLFNTHKQKNFQSPQPTRQDIGQVSTGTSGEVEDGWQTEDKTRKDLYVPPFYSQPSHFSDYKTYKNWQVEQNRFKGSGIKQGGSTILGGNQGGQIDIEMEDCIDNDKDIQVAIANAEIIVGQGPNEEEQEQKLFL